MRLRHYPHKVPENVHPVVQRLYAEMNDQQATQVDVCERSGVCGHAIRDWRRHGNPTLLDLEAVLNVLGLTLSVKVLKE